MKPESEKPSAARPSFLTLLALIVVAAPIVVANLSRDERPPQTWPPPNPAYGWPLVWYWCEFKASTTGGIAATSMTPELVEWSVGRLAANVAIWVLILAAVGFVCQWLLRRFAPAWRFRPRILTLLALTVLVTLIVLSNLSGVELMSWSQPGPTYGWPLIWRSRDVQPGYGVTTVLDQNYSTVRLVGNLATWLAMLAVSYAACQWLQRRYPPRFRWSLRTMLIAVALTASLCAWCVSMRERAKRQDPVIDAAAKIRGPVYLHMERWGPQWLDLVGADHFRRSVVGADLHYDLHSFGDDDEELIKSLNRLPDLRYLDLEVSTPVACIPTALGNLSQLRTLRVSIEISIEDAQFSRECLAAIGKLTQLEELHLGGFFESHDLGALAGLTNLKSLSLQFDWYDDAQEADQLAMNDAPLQLAHLPPLPRLETLDLRRTFWGWSLVGNESLRRLAVLPRLKSLNLSAVKVTDAGLAELASLESLEELAIGVDQATPERLQSLLAIERLRSLHIQRFIAVTKEIVAALPSQESIEKREREGDAMFDWERSLNRAFEHLQQLRFDRYGSYANSDRLTTVTLDHGDQILALQSEVNGLRRALDAMRKARPGIVIDSDPKWFDQGRGVMPQKPPWEK